MIATDLVYATREALDHPEAAPILARLRPSHVTVVADAAALFNRPGQRFEIQKRRPRFILAVKRGTFLYEGSERVQSFGADRPVHYLDVVRNCLYDCDYCFLQGMHRSANILVHVNRGDYLEALDDAVARLGGLYLSISYVTDLLGFESQLGMTERWIAAIRSRPAVEMEIRTKSDGYGRLASLEPLPNVILTWSVSPDEVAREHESGTAAFQQRLFDASRAARRGWRVRLCFDPVIVTPDWRDRYARALDAVARRLPDGSVEALSFGVFRMHPDFLARLDGAGPRAVRYRESATGRDGGPASYPETVRAEVFDWMSARLGTIFGGDRVFGVHG